MVELIITFTYHCKSIASCHWQLLLTMSSSNDRSDSSSSSTTNHNCDDDNNLQSITYLRRTNHSDVFAYTTKGNDTGEWQ